MAKEIDLQQFCGDRDGSRPYLSVPFSVGEFTYATNGHIMVRVARRPDAADSPLSAERQAKFNVPLAGLDSATFSPATFKLPALPESDDDCQACDGRGTEHDCPDCECQCRDCDGTGRPKPKASVAIHGINFQYRYVKQFLSLPSIEISATASNENPLLFRFKGGVGALMSYRGTNETHFDADELAAAA